MPEHYPMSMSCIWVNDMGNTSRYNIAKCCVEKTCPKCGSIADAIVVNRGTHHTLYCANCGSYIKHASVDDKHHIYLAKAKVQDNTPVKVCMLYVESEKTMTTKLK